MLNPRVSGEVVPIHGEEILVLYAVLGCSTVHPRLQSFPLKEKYDTREYLGG